VALLLENLALDPIGALQAPDRRREAKRERLLQRAEGREIVHERRLRLERASVLVRDHDEPPGAKAVLQRVLRRARLAFFRFRAARLRPVAPASLGARVRGGNGSGGDRRTGRGGACTGHGGIPCWLREKRRRRSCGGRPERSVYPMIGILSSNWLGDCAPALIARQP
jgi:hypothetical protein